MYALMDEKQQRIFEEEKELDFSFSLPGRGGTGSTSSCKGEAWGGS